MCSVLHDFDMWSNLLINMHSHLLHQAQKHEVQQYINTVAKT